MKKCLMLAGLAVLLSSDLSAMEAVYDEATGQVRIHEKDQPVLTYVYKTQPIPEGFFDGLEEGRLASARKYAVPRSNYIHPLYGPDRQILTKDWSPDHPHHRGVYWAWPEVQFQGEMGDLHALQRVWARPTGKITTRRGPGWSELEAENNWMWEDKTPLVRERVTIRAWKAHTAGRHIDLSFSFEALEEGVTLARRGMNAYGGLNPRLAKIADMRLTHHADPEGSTPRMAWQTASGRWAGSDQTLSMTIFEKATNPYFPGDYVQYPDLPWLQPAFPGAGLRHALEPGKPLDLNYRIWIQPGEAPAEAALRRQWNALND